MSELEKTKNLIAQQIKRLCAHCSNEVSHNCPIQNITDQVLRIHGVPLIVNDEFKGVIFHR